MRDALGINLQQDQIYYVPCGGRMVRILRLRFDERSKRLASITHVDA